MPAGVNQTIAKNTFALYIRMLFLMVVNLYTSRVILDALGVQDYGVYNAVAGFIAMFSMISASLSTAISRFIAFVLGQGDVRKLHKVFCTSLTIQVSIALIVVALVEIFGVWFLNAKMTVPDGREVAANWVLQLSLVTFVINLLNAPYNAALIAHEKMSAFAYIGIFEGCANLAVAYLVMMLQFDKLISYAALICLVALITRIMYAVYCKSNFEECAFSLIFDKGLFQEMFSFAGWNFVGSASGLLREQGINILFNIYYGPVVNAARGLASQVDAAVNKFTGNFFTAVQPQIIKSYAHSQFDDAHALVLRSSRLAFFMMMAIVLPVISETDFLLGIWLKDVPEHTVAFVRIVLLSSLFQTFSQPLIHLMLATGNIRKYQLVVGSVNILNFPVAWFVLAVGGSPELSLLTVVVFSIISLLLRVVMLRPMTGFPGSHFMVAVVFRCLCVFSVCSVPAICFSFLMPLGVIRFMLNSLVTECLLATLVYFIGLDSSERAYIVAKLKTVVRNR